MTLLEVTSMIALKLRTLALTPQAPRASGSRMQRGTIDAHNKNRQRGQHARSDFVSYMNAMPQSRSRAEDD